MTHQTRIAVGTRVRLKSASHVITLRSNTGCIVRPDRWDGYYIVHLDKPALYHEPDGRVLELEEIREDADNMEVLTD